MAVAASIVLLSGCATAQPVPPVPTSDDWAALSHARIDYLWQQTGIDDFQRPIITPQVPVDALSATIAFSGCMENAGFGGYETLDGAVSVTPFSDRLPVLERLGWYRCYVANPRTRDIEPMTSQAQYDYLYDYYRDSLVPCLERFGYEITDVPSREQFSLALPDDSVFFMAPSQWSPYDAIGPWVADHPEIERVCPAMPPVAAGWFRGGTGQELLLQP